jgi:hypothetical protein
MKTLWNSDLRLTLVGPLLCNLILQCESLHRIIDANSHGKGAGGHKSIIHTRETLVLYSIYSTPFALLM